METSKLPSVWNLLRSRQPWLLAAVIFLGRMAYFAYWGTLLEIDSLGYLKFQAALYHPPLYSGFSWAALQIGGVVDAIIVAQCLLYSLSAGLLVGRWGKTGRMQLLIAILLALEPCSGKLACTVMAETVFLSLLMLAWLALPKLRAVNWRQACLASAWIGLLMGLAYQTRYAAPVFVVAVICWMLAIRLPWRRMLMGTAVILLAFQCALLPLRMYYQAHFGTLQTNAFSSLSLWNTSAYLHPGSAVAIAPDTGFERFLTCFPDADYEIYHTWHTNQMFHDSLAFQRFVNDQRLGTADILDAAGSSGATAWKLLLASPMRHLREFVWPNVKRPFSVQDHIHSNLLPMQMDEQILFHRHKLHFYWPAAWGAIFGLLLLSSGLQLRYRKRLPAHAGLLILSCWLYLAGIAGLAVIFLRFVYVLAPLVVLALGIQAEALLKRKSE
ncbi:MAG TPA: hypothetical protein VHS96_11290 [Bacteroidia bacterium]|nr:hypothetical protein [Bacteroidia bacterium]